MSQELAVNCVATLHTKSLLLVPEVNRASADLLQGVSSDDFVTVWLFAPHINLIVSPTDAFTAKGT